MITLTQNAYTAAWSCLGHHYEPPKAILCISAHWYVDGLHITGSPNPATIHDFNGFPEALSRMEYPAPGQPELAQTLAERLKDWGALMDDQWGFDHGSWTILRHLYPRADIPVLQLSLNKSKTPEWHFDLGKTLSALREEGILILGSGNVIHNLSLYDWNRPNRPPYDWAERFEKRVCEWLLHRDFDPLIRYEKSGSDALRAIPTPEHYLPLLTVLGTITEKDNISFPVQGSEGGSISMLSIQIGG